MKEIRKLEKRVETIERRYTFLKYIIYVIIFLCVIYFMILGMKVQFDCTPIYEPSMSHMPANVISYMCK